MRIVTGITEARVRWALNAPHDKQPTTPSAPVHGQTAIDYVLIVASIVVAIAVVYVRVLA